MSVLTNNLDNVEIIADRFIGSKNDEGCIADLFKIHLLFNHVEKMLQTAKIARYRFEFPVKGCRIDLVLFHVDGGISMIEIKSGNSPRIIVSGIGQLFMYESMYLDSYKNSKPKYLNKYLIFPSISEVSDSHVEKACEVAGINYLVYPGFPLIEKHRKDCIGKWVKHG